MFFFCNHPPPPPPPQSTKADFQWPQNVQQILPTTVHLYSYFANNHWVCDRLATPDSGWVTVYLLCTGPAKPSTAAPRSQGAHIPACPQVPQAHPPHLGRAGLWQTWKGSEVKYRETYSPGRQVHTFFLVVMFYIKLWIQYGGVGGLGGGDLCKALSVLVQTPHLADL